DTKSTGMLLPVHFYRGADRQAPMPSAAVRAFSESFRQDLDPFLRQSSVGPNMAAETTCAYCKAVHARSLYKCSRCSSVRYCGRECQKSHWRAHKQDCQRTADLRAREPAPPRSRVPVAEQLRAAIAEQQETEEDAEREAEEIRAAVAAAIDSSG
ncbi:hypothetical protein KFL_012910010, partial [Klebsormidium nitens]